MSSQRICMIGALVALSFAWNMHAEAAPLVLYERPLTAQEKAARRIGHRTSPVKRSISEAEWVEKYRQAVMPDYIIKVELLEDDPKNEHRYLRLYSIRDDYVRHLDDADWLAPRQQKLPLKIDEKAYRIVESDMRCHAYPNYEFDARVERKVTLTQRIESLDGKQHIRFTLTDISPHRITHHELMGRVGSWAALSVEGKQTSIGHAYVATTIDLKRKMPAYGASWISGDHYLVHVECSGATLEKMLALVSKQYPSSLKATQQIDHLRWIKAEIQICLDQLGEIAEKKAGPDELYSWAVYRVMRRIHPASLKSTSLVQPFGQEHAREYHRVLSEWWKQRQETAIWDFRKGLRVRDAHGNFYSPLKDAEHLRRLEMKVPMTEEEIAVARGKLIEFFEAHWKENADRIAGWRDKERKVVRWERTGDETWLFRIPDLKGTGFYQKEFTSPSIEHDPKDELFPLRATFKYSERIPDRVEPGPGREHYLYHRYDEQWRTSTGGGKINRDED